MQAENQNFSEFFSRTEALAEKLGIRAVDLPDVMGLSKAMLFAYRKGKYPISWRAWRKLEAAERAAGLLPAEEAHGAASGPGDPCESPARSVSGEAWQAEMAKIREELAAMRKAMERLAAKIDAAKIDKKQGKG